MKRKNAREEEHKKMEERGRGRPKKIKIAPQSHNSLNYFFSFLINLRIDIIRDRDQITVNDDDDLPEFFKVHVSEIYSERMRIPPDFIEKFGRKKPAIVTLKTTSGISFRADMKKINECWFLEKGWPEFVKENSVEEGDFLTFSYAGKSVFNVKVFAKNGCIKSVDNLEEDEPS
ncbi:PREDICTED: B3 domain-containing protein At1g16640-like [Erythranthe guttata]|uniref:B3 domain-containing protein At1g16640-like n=1 Tax=Erythranthe guttata TaxID=4155 RepID=UPI00064DD94B|nr:PREDICTED: B3 domain-containing protein At1g16640-like [Erythranthe guttata]|eukprot:XP_012844349.1 PREDICTED: B3 domain-containing protein At1g16640-like [Erythranthe guttata]